MGEAALRSASGWERVVISTSRAASCQCQKEDHEIELTAPHAMEVTISESAHLPHGGQLLEHDDTSSSSLTAGAHGLFT